jgi:hypothetical protein
VVSKGIWVLLFFLGEKTKEMSFDNQNITATTASYYIYDAGNMLIPDQYIFGGNCLSNDKSCTKLF